MLAYHMAMSQDAIAISSVYALMRLHPASLTGLSYPASLNGLPNTYAKMQHSLSIPSPPHDPLSLSVGIHASSCICANMCRAAPRISRMHLDTESGREDAQQLQPGKQLASELAGGEQAATGSAGVPAWDGP